MGSPPHLPTNPPPHRRAAPLVVGLIGGIGSGKSAVAAAFARQGAVVVSGDVAGHEALQQPKIRQQVVQRWGQAMLDDRGEIDRRKLAAIVFNDPAERKTLEAMVFPWIERRLREQIMAAKQDRRTPLIILDAAVMLEAGWDHGCNRLIYINVPREVRLRRLAERGWELSQIEAREKAQWPLEEKASRADAIIDNGGDRAETSRQVEALVGKWKL